MALEQPYYEKRYLATLLLLMDIFSERYAPNNICADLKHH
jgi:hypothetical protein